MTKTQTLNQWACY